MPLLHDGENVHPCLAVLECGVAGVCYGFNPIAHSGVDLFILGFADDVGYGSAAQTGDAAHCFVLRHGVPLSTGVRCPPVGVVWVSTQLFRSG